MSNHSVIEHRANYHYIKVEEDLIAICLGGEANPHCKALILAILEGWTNSKRDKGEDPAIYMTYPQWIKATYWLFGRNVIIDALEELVNEGLVARRDYRIHGKDTFIYILNVRAVQERIRQLPEKAPDDYLPGFNLNAFKNKRVPNQTRPKSNGKTESAVYYQTANAFNKGRNVDTYSELQSNITSDSLCGSAIASPPTHYSSQEIPVTYAEALAYLQPHGGPPPDYDGFQIMGLARRLWVEAHKDDFALTEEDLAPEDEEDITDAPTVHRLKVVRPEVEQTPLPTSKPAQETPPVHVEAVSEQDAPGQDETPSQLSPKVEELSTGYAPEQHTLMVVPPRESARLQKKVARGKPEKEAKPEPTPEEIALQERCKTWYDRITEHCGGPMTKAGQVINEHKSIKLACQKFSDTQLELIFVYLTTRDWKWSKIDNKYTVRCYILWDESGRVAQILKEESETKKPPSRSASPTSKPENPYSISALRTRQAKQRQMQGVTL